VVSLDVDAGDPAGTPTLVETVTFSFNKIEVEYTPQTADGLPGGSTIFQDSWSHNS